MTTKFSSSVQLYYVNLKFFVCLSFTKKFCDCKNDVHIEFLPVLDYFVVVFF